MTIQKGEDEIDEIYFALINGNKNEMDKKVQGHNVQYKVDDVCHTAMFCIDNVQYKSCKVYEYPECVKYYGLIHTFS